MSQKNSNRNQRTRTEDALMYDITERILGYQAAIVAYELGLFALIAGVPRTLQEVCAELNLNRRPVEALLAVCVSLGLVKAEDERYFLEPIAEDYLLENSPSHFNRFIDGAMLSDTSLFSYDRIKNAFTSDKSQVYDGEPIFESHQAQEDRAREFTHVMHGHSMAPAGEWPNHVELGENQIMLDIGGGSGAHSIGATKRWPKLTAVVFEMASVCEVAGEYATSYGLEERIKTQVGDMWKDPYPPADIHFYSNIYHDWPPEKGRLLTEKSFASLESGGRIIIHEMLFSDDKAGPFTVASFSVAMLLWTEGQQYSGRELTYMLADAGFEDIEVKPTFGYWSIVTGRKP